MNAENTSKDTDQTDASLASAPPLDFPDRKILDAYWERYHRMVVQENEIWSRRMKLILTIQGFLVSAFGLSVKYQVPFSPILAVVGIFVNLAYVGDLRAGQLALERLSDGWNDLADKYKQVYFAPPVIGRLSKRKRDYYLSPRFVLPAVLAIAWVLILIFQYWPAT